MKPETEFCAACFSPIPEGHFERRAYHDHEHCSVCGNDFLGGKWYSSPISEFKAKSIKSILNIDESVSCSFGKHKSQI